MKKYLIFIIFIFVININIVDAGVKVDDTRPNDITLTTKNSDCKNYGCVKGAYIYDNKPIKTYKKKGTVGTETGVHLYCAEKNAKASDVNTTLSLPNELGDRFSCFIFNTLDTSDVKTNYYAMNQGVFWNFLGKLNINNTKHFTDSGKNHMNGLKNTCPSSFAIQKPSITISRPSGDAGKKKLVGNYYNVEINLSHSNNDYSKMTGKLNVSLSGAPSGTIVATTETGAGVTQLDNGASKFYIRIPSSKFVKLTTQLNITVTVSSASVKYKAFEYCETTTVNGVTSCAAGIQPLVPRRLFQVDGEDVTASKTITINPLSKCTYIVTENSSLGYNVIRSPEDFSESLTNSKVETSDYGEKNVNLYLNVIKKCDPADGTGETTANISFTNVATITENSEFSFNNLSDEDKIWAGGAVNISASSSNKIVYKLNDIGTNANLESKIKNILGCDLNTENCTFDTSSVSVNNVNTIIRSKLRDGYNNLSNFLSTRLSISDDIGVIAKLNGEVNEGHLSIIKRSKPAFSWTSGEEYELEIENSISIKPKTSYLNLRTGNVSYGTSCATEELCKSATDKYYTSLKYFGKKYTFYIRDENGKNSSGFKRWYYFDSLTEATQSIDIKSKIYTCVDVSCEKPKFNLFYRQIDVNNPFPKGDYSETNWVDYDGNEDNIAIISELGAVEYVVPLSEVVVSNDYSLSNIGTTGESSLFKKYAGTGIGENIKTIKPKFFGLGAVGGDAR